ncbi:MAG: hypothetical protein OIF58_02920 [Cohaesibacter sp.]|nr:hypothetical protein [Cohaesibacter sp.]
MKEASSSNRIGNIREIYSSQIWSRSTASFYDPSYHFSILLSLPLLMRELNSEETNIVFQNIIKIRYVVRVSVIVILMTIIQFYQMKFNEFIIFISLSAIVSIISGIAWFVVTIGSTKKELFPVAIDFTKWLLTAFINSCLILTISTYYTLPLGLAIIVTIPIILLLYSAIIYDHLDSLSVGLDDELRRQALTSLVYYHGEGVTIISSNEELEDIIGDANEQKLVG